MVNTHLFHNYRGGLIGGDLYDLENSKIAKIDWHPWGEDGKSLLILTEDAVLR